MNLEKKIKLKDNERVVCMVRRYGLTFFWSWLAVFVLISAPFFFLFWLFNHDWWGKAIFIISAGFGGLWFLRTLFIWQKNILVLTNQRLIDFAQLGLFNKVVSTISYDDVEDVFGEIKGFWGTIFRYGKIIIQSNNSKTQIEVNKIKQPIHIQQEILELRARYLGKYAHDFADNSAEAIIDKLYELEMTDLLRVKEVLEKRMNKLRG